MTMSNDLWADTPMTRRQIMVIAMCCILNAFDGIDILAISFASPGIAAEWGVNKAELGVVLSMELVGMTIGSTLFGMLADSRGRRFVVLTCLMISTAGMWLATEASSVTMLSTFRLLTGMGIGGMIATAHSTAAEFSSNKRRNLAIACVGLGWPIGAVVGGSIAARYVDLQHWRHVFIAGATISTIFIPIIWLVLPESLSYLLDKQPRDALKRANSVLSFLGHPTLLRLPSLQDKRTGANLHRGRMLYGLTAALAIAYFFDSMTYYFLLKWSPKMVADMGFDAGNASSVLVWGTVATFAALLMTGWAATRVNPRKLLPPGIALALVGVSAFGFSPPTIVALSTVMFIGTFFNQAVNSLMIMIIVDSFPPSIRAGRLGLVMGLGRGGAALSPIIAGLLLNLGYPLWVVTVTLSAPLLVAGAVVLSIKTTSEPPLARHLA